MVPSLVKLYYDNFSVLGLSASSNSVTAAPRRWDRWQVCFLSLFCLKKGRLDSPLVVGSLLVSVPTKFVDHLHAWLQGFPPQLAVESGIVLSDQSENSGFGYVHRALLLLAVWGFSPDPLSPEFFQWS